MNRGAIVFPALTLAFTTAMLAVGYFHYHYSWTAFAFPFAAGVALCLLCAFEIAALPRRHAAGAPGAADPLSLAGMAWLFALAGFLYAFGFIFGAALYLFVCLKGNRFSWRLSLGTAIASLLIGWGLFVKVLGVQLPITPLWMG
jgi:hypothetical protein